MASGPFSDAGLSMFGTAEKSFASKAMSGGDKNGKLKNLLGIMLSGFVQGDANSTGVAPPALGQGLSMPVMPGGQGINPNKRSMLGMTPGSFQFTGMPAAPGMSTGQPSEDMHSSVDNFWG